MEYSLRPRVVQDLLMEEDELENFFGALSDDEADHISVQSEFSDEILNFDDDLVTGMEVENETINACILELRTHKIPINKRKKWLRGKNGYTWNSKVPERMSDPTIPDQPLGNPGPKGAASELETITEFWNVLFSDEILGTIVEHTNACIEDTFLQIIEKEQECQSYHHITDESEIKALISIFYYAGLWKSSKVGFERLWSSDNGINFYKCVMTKARFIFLSNCLRFDDKSKRNRNDRFSPVRNIWYILINNYKDNYEPSEFCTVGKLLLGFRGQCNFQTFINSEPEKYGLQIFTLNDAETNYLIYGIPDLGKIILEDETQSVSEYFFREVTKPIHNQNRTVTCDNWFTSIPLIERMQNEPFNITITGTIHKNKPEIPAEMKVSRKNPPQVKYCFSPSKITLLSYTPKKNQTVLLCSSYLHSTKIIDGKPEIMLHYNATKDATNCFDKLCRSFTTARSNNCWPTRVFFGMLDQAAVNARILLMCQNKRKSKNVKVSAQDCLTELILALAKPQLEKRLAVTSLPASLKYGIMAILKKDQPSEIGDVKRPRLQKQLRCKLCKRSKDKKTMLVCPSCERPMCDEHRVYLCVQCSAQE